MPSRSFDSQTRLGIPRPPKSQRAPQPAQQGEQYADEGTLILEPAPISVAPGSFAPVTYATIPPPPPSSMRPMTYSVPPPSSVRPPMPSWDDRSGWAPTGSPSEITASTRLPAKRPLSARERSAISMILIATAAMLAALISIGFMRKASESTTETAAAAQPVAQPVAVQSNAATIPAPSAASIAPPVQPIDIDDVKPTPAPAPVKVAPATVAAPATPATPATPAPQAKPAAAEPKPKAPSSTAQQKALEDLLEQLGEEQLKR